MKWCTAFAVSVIFISMPGHTIHAQGFKFGHINKEELIQKMPEFDSARVQLERYRTELVNYLESMSDELEKKNDAYTREGKNLTPAIKQVREQELADLNRRIQEFQNAAQDQLQEKQVALIQPVYTKVEQAIKDVGKENDFLYIFNTSDAGMLSYFDESKSTDVTFLVKARLKLK